MQDSRTVEAEEHKLATPDEISRYLVVPVPTLYQWRVRGVGPKGIRVGKHIRYRWADVERWLDEQQQASTAA